MDTFPFPYKYEINRTPQFANTTVGFESQKKQKQAHSINGLDTWEISCLGNAAQYKQMLDFFNAQKGSFSKFNFTDEFGNTQVVRFADDKLKLTALREFDPTSSTKGTVVGYKGTITLEKAL